MSCVWMSLRCEDLMSEGAGPVQHVSVATWDVAALLPSITRTLLVGLYHTSVGSADFLLPTHFSSEDAQLSRNFHLSSTSMQLMCLFAHFHSKPKKMLMAQTCLSFSYSFHIPDARVETQWKISIYLFACLSLSHENVQHRNWVEPG